MSLLRRALVTVATALAAAVVTLPVVAAPASAHAGEKALLVEPQSTWPGGTVMVRGDLPVTSDVNLLLVDAAGRMTPVARVDDPPSGHFDVPVTVPASTRLGAWSIVAVAGGDALGRVALTVGAAPPETAERADQAEPILAPGAAAASAPAAQGSGGSPAVGAGSGQALRAAPTQSPEPPRSLTAGQRISLGLIAVGLTAYVVVHVRRRRSLPH